MITLHSVGEIVNGYRIEEVLDEDPITLFYRAKKDGRDIFLKQYQEPSSKDAWFRRYLKYELQVKSCIESGPVKENACEIIDIFEWESVIYQAMEFIPDSMDLWDFIVAAQNDRPGSSSNWEQRVLYAKALMDCITKLHASDLIHSDLKPQNFILVKNESDSPKCLLRIIGLDRAIINGRDFPWGKARETIGYCSPERLTDQVPIFASDVFTCGIILYVLLCNYFPFEYESLDEYKEQVLGYDHFIPSLLEPYPDANNEDICQMLELCLHPDPTKRPTAKEVYNLLHGRKSDEYASRVIRPGADKGFTRLSQLSTRSPVYGSFIQVQLEGSVGSIKANIKTDIGRQTLHKICGDDSKYSADVQYTIIPEDDSWFVIPNTDATNETILNGKKIIEKTMIKSGDQIGIGREEKGIVKAIVTVK